ncbi:MAG TPA: hypothetical protein VLN58_02065 [Verrucomicrobiae bacterium]|nr:hypothetical protein [Verrucomicrobiae bacterium]
MTKEPRPEAPLLVRARRYRPPNFRIHGGAGLLLLVAALPFILGYLTLMIPYFFWTGPVGAALRNRVRVARYAKAVQEWEARNRV